MHMQRVILATTKLQAQRTYHDFMGDVAQNPQRHYRWGYHPIEETIEEWISVGAEDTPAPVLSPAYEKMLTEEYLPCEFEGSIFGILYVELL